MADKKFTGTAFITLAGRRMGTIPGSGVLNPGGVVRTPVTLDGNVVGFTEKATHAEIDCEIGMTGDVDIIALNNATGMTIMFEADSGQAYVVRNAQTMEPIKHQAEKTPAKFFGSKAEPV